MCCLIFTCYVLVFIKDLDSLEFNIIVFLSFALTTVTDVFDTQTRVNNLEMKC